MAKLVVAYSKGKVKAMFGSLGFMEIEREVHITVVVVGHRLKHVDLRVS
jgi:hypothetical protein